MVRPEENQKLVRKYDKERNILFVSEMLTYSSRNFLLNQSQKKIASNIYKLILKKKRDLIKKSISINKIKDEILKMKINKIEYLKIVDTNKIVKPYKKRRKYKIFIAYYLGSTRLIDNI